MRRNPLAIQTSVFDKEMQHTQILGYISNKISMLRGSESLNIRRNPPPVQTSIFDKEMPHAEI